MLWRRYSNAVATAWQRWTVMLSQHRKLTSVQLSFSTLPQRCDNVNNDVVTTLSQLHCFSWVNWQFWLFGPNLPKKGVPVKNRKSEHHHWILLIRISLGIKFSLNWQFWFFEPNLPTKWNYNTSRKNIWKVHNVGLHWNSWGRKFIKLHLFFRGVYRLPIFSTG